MVISAGPETWNMGMLARAFWGWLNAGDQSCLITTAGLIVASFKHDPPRVVQTSKPAEGKVRLKRHLHGSHGLLGRAG